MARTTSSPDLAPRLPTTTVAPAWAIANAVALPIPVPPPVTMEILLVKDVMSAALLCARAGANGQRGVVAVEVLDGGEDQFGVADVLDVVEQVFAGAEM